MDSTSRILGVPHYRYQLNMGQYKGVANKKVHSDGLWGWGVPQGHCGTPGLVICTHAGSDMRPKLHKYSTNSQVAEFQPINCRLFKTTNWKKECYEHGSGERNRKIYEGN